MNSNRAKIRLSDLVDYLVERSRAKLKEQGHSLSGRLIKSLAPTVKETGDGLTAEVLWEAYGSVIESGLSRDRVPYSPGSGAKSSKFIDGLIDYVKRRGLRPRKGQTIKGIAFAIARSGKQVGFPLPGSRRYSKTGRRTGAIAETFSQNNKQIREGIDEAGIAIIEDEIELAISAISSGSITIYDN